MSSDVAVKINHVRKAFNLPIEGTTSLKRKLTNYFKGIRGYERQEVLKDISLDIEKGDFFGIVGRNGSGKSTLLKIISQIYVPDEGSVTVNGRLVSFIELGVGFNPELTGRENIYLNGAMLGFSVEEINSMYDEIVDFAELRPFMNQKLKNYSSGMQVRLAFAVAIQAKSDILVLDEILAVGDEAFQRKCNDYFLNVKKEGKTVILVTHSMEAVRKYCNRAALIENGYVKVVGNPEKVATQYSLDNVKLSGKTSISKQTEKAVIGERVKTIDPITDFSVKLLSNEVLDSESTSVEFEISYKVNADIETYIAFSLTDINRNVWMYNDNSLDVPTKGAGEKKLRYTCDLPMVNHCLLELVVSVRNLRHEPLYIADVDNRPKVIVSEDAELSESARDSATGILKRNGTWDTVN